MASFFSLFFSSPSPLSLQQQHQQQMNPDGLRSRVAVLEDGVETSSISSTFYTDLTQSSTCCSTPMDQDPKGVASSLQTTHPGYGTSSIGGSTMNLTNAMMGSGIIGLPLALHLCGFWFGLVCSVVIAVLTWLAMHLTVQCGIQTNRYSLAALCDQLLVGGDRICNCMIVFHTATTTISYYISKWSHLELLTPLNDPPLCLL